MNYRQFEKSVVIAAALMLCIISVRGEEPVNFSYLVGAVARNPGQASSLWRSDLVLHNPGDEAAQVTLSFIERGPTGPVTDERSVMVEPGASVLIEDLLATLFSRETAGGALLLECPTPLVTSSRTFNLSYDAGGLKQTWGQFVPAIDVETFAASRLHLLPHLAENHLFRTNLGLVNLGYDDLLAWVDPDVFDGEDPKARMYRVPAEGMNQIDRPLAETGEPIDDAMITVDTGFLSGPFLAWASVVDNGTGDAVFVPPIQPLTGEIYIPAAAHAPGANGAVWRTDLEVTGDPHLPVSYRIDWLPADTDNSMPSGVEFSLEPGQARRHIDVVGDDLGANGTGALRITMLSGYALITGRSYTVTEAGTFGQFTAGRPVSEATREGGKAVLVHLRQSADPMTGYRSNVGAVNVSAITIELVVDCFTADGTDLGAVNFTLGPYSSHQVNRFLLGLVPEGIDLAYAIVSTQTDSGAFLTYTSVIDNRSNDPIFVPGQNTQDLE